MFCYLFNFTIFFDSCIGSVFLYLLLLENLIIENLARNLMITGLGICKIYQFVFNESGTNRNVNLPGIVFLVMRLKLVNPSHFTPNFRQSNYFFKSLKAEK